MAVIVDKQNWQYYSGGIWECDPYADYPVLYALLVGYTADAWILKNSWGSDWGEDGYIRVSRDPDYNCQIGAEVFVF